MEPSKEERIPNFAINYCYPTMSAKIRKMSKRRQKIALRRKLEKELLRFVGRKADTTTWNELWTYSDDLADAFFGKLVF